MVRIDADSGQWKGCLDCSEIQGVAKPSRTRGARRGDPLNNKHNVSSLTSAAVMAARPGPPLALMPFARAIAVLCIVIGSHRADRLVAVHPLPAQPGTGNAQAQHGTLFRAGWLVSGGIDRAVLSEPRLLRSIAGPYTTGSGGFVTSGRKHHFTQLRTECAGRHQTGCWYRTIPPIV